MKYFLFFLLFLFGDSLFSQNNPKVIFATPSLIKGIGEVGTSIKISTNNDYKEEITISVDSIDGSFKHKFNPSLKVGSYLILWAVNTKKEASQRISIKVEKASDILASIDEMYFIDANFDYNNSIFYLIQQSWKANRKPSTGSIPYVTPIMERRIPLQEGEGSGSNFYLLEADLNLMYPLFGGREDGNGGAFSKFNLISFYYGFNFRMTLDKSKPLTPSSNRIGLSWTYNLFNNYSKWSINSWGKDINDLQYKIKNKNLKFWNFSLQALHYSNGQSGNSNLILDGRIRNNYKNGDFSTNYIYGQLTYGRYLIPSYSLFQASFGYRVDLGSENGALAYSADQYAAYGRHRFKLILDNRTKVRTFICAPVSYHFRIETQYILDDLSKFEPNNNTNNKYRWNVRGMFEISPEINRSVGFFISFYYGRDYLNIRYDDIVFVTQLGLTLSLDKYYVPFQKIAK